MRKNRLYVFKIFAGLACLLPGHSIGVSAETMPLSGTIPELLRNQGEGTMTCKSIAEVVIARAEMVEKAGLNAFITLNPNLVEDARRLDETRKAGRIRPLHCVPVALKDNMNTSDMPTTAGASALAGMQPAADAFVVSRLREAGALIVGKTNLDELAVAGSSISSIKGQTLNPWDRTRNPAGSSGGSAVAVATGVVLAALGTETVNSIRNPANVTGVVGVRPSRGIVSRRGVLPLSPTMDVVGCFAGNVTDAATVLAVIAGRDAADPATAAATALDIETLVPNGLGNLSGRRIGVLKELFGSGPEHQATNDLINAALSDAADNGATLVTLEDVGLDTATMVKELNVNNWEFRGAFERYLFDLGDRAPIHSLSEYVSAASFPERTMGNYLKNAMAWKAGEEETQYRAALGKIEMMRERVLKLLADKNLDVLVYPAMKRPAYMVDEKTAQDRNGVLASALGFPALNIPVGMTASMEKAPMGLPVGIDLMGKPGEDGALLGLAANWEKLLPARPSPIELLR